MADDEVRISLGDRADKVSVGSPFTTVGYIVRGEGGDDVMTSDLTSDILSGGAGDDVIRGGEGFDLLDAGGGRDRVFGGPHNDHIYDQERRGSVDVFDGGAGRDMVHYSNFRGNLDIDLARRPVSRGLRADRLRGFEDVQAGGGTNRLAGDERPNYFGGGRGGSGRFHGRGGNDVISVGNGGNRVYGGRGDDTLRAGGTDAVRGGPGDDFIGLIDPLYRLSDKRASTLAVAACGRGEDTVSSAPKDTVSGCEEAMGWGGAFWLRMRPRAEDGDAVYRVQCQATRCKGTVKLMTPRGAALGSATVDVPDTRGEYVDLRVALNAAGRSALEAGDRMRVLFQSAPGARFPDIPAKRVLTFGFTA
jgi:Ca2+-binding RTX toxin-like protein